MASGTQRQDLIGYDALQQEAMRGLIRSVLKRAAAKGLPGDHHFFITFKTGAPGVSAPADLLARYPDEMMIVLQHQFWDLAPGETYFSVTLQFGGKPKSLSIPYAAITQFIDPAADFRLQFPPPGIAEAPAEVPAPAREVAAETAPAEPPGEKVVSLDHFRKK